MIKKPQPVGNTRLIAPLLALYCYNDLSDTEKAGLDRWLIESEEVKRIFTDAPGTEQGLRTMREAINLKYQQIKSNRNLAFSQPARQKPRRVIWMRRTAAAVFIIAACMSIFVWQNKNAHADALPGAVRATLILDNGKQVELENAADGSLAEYGYGFIEKKNNKLIYSSATSNTSATSDYNTITTPLGGTYSFQLADGTNIWLNAGSSVSYPANFTDNERKVILTGEAYFEVTSIPMTSNSGFGKMPFIVELKDKAVFIEVVGTHFNVNAYPDEDNTRVTLVQGEIKVIKDNQTITLKPQQEASMPLKGKTIMVAETDGQNAMAWKNEIFRFDDTNLVTIMKQVGRWYDRKIVYEGIAPNSIFKGSIGRNNRLSTVLQVLELNGVYCTIEGKKIIVKTTKG